MLTYDNLKGKTASIFENSFKYGYGDKKTNDGKHFVNWSGGTDSTLLLYELLQYYGSENVKAVTWKYPWYYDYKYELEKEKRENFKEFLKTQHLDGFEHTEYIVKTDNNDICARPGGTAQSVGWLMAMPLFMSDGDYFYDTTIKNDDIIITNSSLIKTAEGASELLDRDIKFRQPYLYYDKRDIIAKLINYGIYDLTWFCEIPELPEPCMRCEPCKLHTSSLSWLANFHRNPKIREFAQEKYEEYCKMDPFKMKVEDVEEIQIDITDYRR